MSNATAYITLSMGAYSTLSSKGINLWLKILLSYALLTFLCLLKESRKRSKLFPSFLRIDIIEIHTKAVPMYEDDIREPNDEQYGYDINLPNQFAFVSDLIS